jgi:thiamine biosynthesis lipoprotein ApbE
MVVKNKIIPICLGIGWLLSLAISIFLAYENINLRSSQTHNHVRPIESTEIMQQVNGAKKTTEWQLFDLDDINYFRNQAKIDGKVEAMLLMINTSNEITEQQASKIIELAEKKSAETLSTDKQFLSLLCQSAFHKGMSTGQEVAKEEMEKQYEDGYHKATEDFSCPETGKIVIPEKKIDMNKPSK